MKTIVNQFIDRLQAAFPVNRIVVILTPAFAAASGWLATFAADNLPGGLQISGDWLTGIFISGAAAAIVAAYKWIDGWQKHEAGRAGFDPASEYAKQ